MKNLIKINPTSFILGAILGGVAIFTIAADSQRPTAWDYKVVYDGLKYNNYAVYTDLLNQTATNGWEVVSAQLIPRPDFPGPEAWIVLKHPKQ